MNGAPVRDQYIPVRFCLTGTDVCTKYFLSFVIMAEADRSPLPRRRVAAHSFALVSASVWQIVEDSTQNRAARVAVWPWCAQPATRAWRFPF